MNAAVQAPLLTDALYVVVAVNAGVVKVVAVSPDKSVQIGLSKRCHWIVVPTFPDNVKVVVDPEQIEEVPETVPATETGATTIPPDTLLVSVGEQVPLTIQ